MNAFSLRLAARLIMALGLIFAAAPSLVAQEIPKVTVAEAGRASFIGQVAITGTLVARDEVMVNPQVGGQQITVVHVDIGDQVQAGDLLAELDRETLEIQVAQARAEKDRAEAFVLQARAQVNLAEASFTSAQTNYERDITLLKSGTITQAKFDQSETTFKAAQASLASAQHGLAVAKVQVVQAAIQLQLAELNLSYTQITAQATGVISARNALIGAVANAGPEPMFRIIRDNLIEVSTKVIETDIARISVGDEATLRISGLGEMTGEVRRISPRVDQLSRLGEVRISLSRNPGLRVGIFAGGWISTEHFDAVAIPESAVMSDADGDFAQVVDSDGIIHKRRIETGLIWSGLRAIRSGLAEGETVVLLAGAFFREGDKVDPIQISARTNK
ncbi:MAG: efflux RND transporter periplasmic adaptor subunit [Amylibacter sp.]|nr:efflux RND transporter periplasmic adaptor subunit [Amylibacter sp.]